MHMVTLHSCSCSVSCSKDLIAAGITHTSPCLFQQILTTLVHVCSALMPEHQTKHGGCMPGLPVTGKGWRLRQAQPWLLLCTLEMWILMLERSWSRHLVLRCCLHWILLRQT